jgi:hypothetical protein
MARKIIAGTYTFVDAPEKLTQFTSATNILFDDSNGTVINYTTAPLPGITTDQFVLAVDRPNETQRYILYAFQAVTSSIPGLMIDKGWYWFNESSTSVDTISTPSVVFSDNCSINDELTTTQANALFTTSPIQVQPTVTTTRVLYKGKKELTMAQFEALTSLDDAVDYDITDFPNGGITNAQMTAALGYSRLFEDGDVFVCLDNGTYTKGNWYQIKVEGGVKSWEDITDGIKIYAVTDILNHDGIKSGTFTEEQMDNIKLADILQVYCIDGDPIYKYAYKGLYPTNPAQSTIGANLYFVAATEKGNYVLAINTDTRNWEVREPASGDLQNYVPKQSEIISQSSVDPDTALTWIINTTPSTNFTATQSNFISNNQSFVAIASTVSQGIYCLVFFGSFGSPDPSFEQPGGGVPVIYRADKGWASEAYRTITFETAPTGELLTWLKANAVPQGSSTKIYAQVTNENGAVSIRVFENSDADLQNLSITKDGVTINGKKPLTSIQPLYKHELVIPYSFSVGDSETVDGSVMYHYLSNTGTQITSASEIDDNFLLSGGIGKNSASTAASQSETTALTWQLNDRLTLFGEETKVFDINFISNNQSFKAICFTLSADPIMYYLTDADMGSGITLYSENFKWMGHDETDHSAYRTITFETAPTGELLTWLQANAVPQGGASPTTVLLLNVNVTKEGSSITVEAVNASTMGYITGTVGTITDTVTQLI